MPVHVERRDGRYRLIEPGGDIATTPQGHARDGKHGHATRAEAERQARAINANIKKAGLRTLYVSRKLLNADELISWAHSQGFTQTLTPDDMHVTICFSRTEIDWNVIPPLRARLRVSNTPTARSLRAMGDKGAVGLVFKSELLSERHNDFMLAGASWDWPSYFPHVTLTYRARPENFADIVPFAEPLLFGPEIYAEVVEDWDEKITERGAA